MFNQLFCPFNHNKSKLTNLRIIEQRWTCENCIVGLSAAILLYIRSINCPYLKRFIVCLFFAITCLYGFSQDATVFGVVRDAGNGRPIDFVTIFVKGTSMATETDADGNYSLKVPAGEPIEIVFRRIGYQETSAKIDALPSMANRYINVKLASKSSELDITIRSSRIEDGGMVREQVTEFKMLPNVSGNLESILPHIALGVSSGTGGELSSQYNVRGGNFDENLIYVNDFEIFRPQLLRASQQEGLSFPNMDLIRDVAFSSGGFESKYGDKMASVMDVRYKRPEETGASITIGLLGASAHLEGSKRLGANAYNKLRYLGGVRYKTTRHVLSSLDLKGEYVPDFVDLQTYITYDITKDFQVGWIANYNYNRFSFIPQSRSTTLGLIDFALRLNTVYEGSQRDRFINGMTGFSFSYVPDSKKNPMYLKLLASIYGSSEEETFDLLGYYRLSQIETGLGSDQFGNEISVLGTGTQHSFARNYLYYQIKNIEHRGGLELIHGDRRGSNFLQWGLNLRLEDFEDQLNEWERLDSAGYSLPYDGRNVNMSFVYKAKNIVSNRKVSLFMQNTYTRKNDDLELRINAGVRTAYLQLGDEWLISPRASLEYRPLNWSGKLSFRVASGLYYQAPLYREFRRLDGSLNTSLKSQKSIHFVGGLNYDFIWKGVSEKPFRLIAEWYYKKMDNLVSYDVDIVRIRYSAENDSRGYATGLDLRINGEFVPDAESWVGISFLSTRESINGVEHLKFVSGDSLPRVVSTVPRPTDRFMNFNMFFQDYLRRNKNAKVFINMSLGSGLPFGRKDDNIVFRNSFRYKVYHRIDLGFSFKLWSEDKKTLKPSHPLRFSRATWLSFEVFNLLDVANTASNTWIKTITNAQYAIPDNLTTRRLNLRFRMDL